MLSLRSSSSAHSLASLLVEPDEYIILTQIKQILDTVPSRRPPLEPTPLLPHLFMGSQRNAGDVYMLKELGVTHVLNCAGLKATAAQRNPYPKDSGVVGYLCIPAEDQPNYDISQHFEDAIQFVNACKESGGRALVHCNLGINRSGAICAAYIMFDQFKPLMDVISYLKQARGLVLCNKGFRRQLVKFAKARNLPITSVSDPSAVLLHNVRKNVAMDTISLPGVLREDCESWDQAGSSQPDNGTHFGQLKPERFATAYCTLPRKAGKERLKSGKRQLSASHYEKESFMDAIPEDIPAEKFAGRERNGLASNTPYSQTERGISTFGSISFAAFRKFKSKSVQPENPPDETFRTSLSTTRPLKVYRRSATDSELYGKPPIQHLYKRADTVATCDATSGIQTLSLTDSDCTRKEKNRDNDVKVQQQQKSNSFFRRFRIDKSNKSVQT